MTRERHFEITIHLDTIQELFTIPTSDPFSERVHFVPGIELIKNELKPALLKAGVDTKTTIFLPPRNIEPDLAHKTKDALQRYCRFRLQQNEYVINALQWDAMKALLAGIIFLSCGLFLLDALMKMSFVPAFLDTLLSAGFNIAFWVILWRPVDFFLFDLPAYWKESKLYKHIMQMEIVVFEEANS